MPDTGNHFTVETQGNDLVSLRLGLRLSKTEAMNLAAWLVALADDNDEFPALLEAVKNI